jgi:hypothetical protein
MTVHPLTRQMLELIDADPRSRARIARIAGVDVGTLTCTHRTLLFTMEAVLGALGYKLEILRNGTTADQATQPDIVDLHRRNDPVRSYVQDAGADHRTEPSNV